VILKRHACELFELSDGELAAFWSDVAVVGKALDDIYRPAKINYCVFGHHCPHIHCHLLVHSYDDDPSKPIDMNEQEVLFSPSEYEQMVSQLRDAMTVGSI
jgi:diadenosine tetraphosphate (Ap4A) HIT family hydrolase